MFRQEALPLTKPFYSIQLFNFIGRDPSTLGRAICFTQSTYSNVHLIQKHSHRHTQNKAWPMSSHPVEKSSRQIISIPPLLAPVSRQLLICFQIHHSLVCILQSFRSRNSHSMHCTLFCLTLSIFCNIIISPILLHAAMVHSCLLSHCFLLYGCTTVYLFIC